ncbi:MAG: hypothetical protein GC162_02070 [Planctomycetes bacterium]|nr:hypothetical protein [Planctomycetota bacterium]
MDHSLTLVYFPSAVVLGALHALEPGHAKTLTAAYLIGVKGTKRDAILLGLSVATTHSILVILLAFGALWLGQEAFTDQATHWLQIGSGVVVIALGSWMLWRRWPRVRRATGHDHAHHHHHHHHHAPDPVLVSSPLATGRLEIVDTPAGERLRLTLDQPAPGLTARVDITRPDGEIEVLTLSALAGDPGVYLSNEAPQEPHEFAAVVELSREQQRDTLPFEMHEPHDHDHDHDHDHAHAHHHHDHDLMDEDEHARAHAATLPEYVRRGERPSLGQIVAFGAAGGMIPCPASVTVMLLALSVGRVGMGMFTVLGFSLGLALALVGIGLIVVAGISKLGSTSRFSWFSRRAPVLSAGVVILSGIAALLFAH